METWSKELLMKASGDNSYCFISENPLRSISIVYNKKLYIGHQNISSDWSNLTTSNAFQKISNFNENIIKSCGVSTSVSSTYVRCLYYLTDKGKLYQYNCDTQNFSQLDTNVKYLDSSGSGCCYTKTNGNSYFIGQGYIDNSSYTQTTSFIQTSTNNIKAIGSSGYLLTEDGSLYYQGNLLYSNVREIIDSEDIPQPFTHLCSFFVTNDGTLYWVKSPTTPEIRETGATNVKKFAVVQCQGTSYGLYTDSQDRLYFAYFGGGGHPDYYYGDITQSSQVDTDVVDIKCLAANYYSCTLSRTSGSTSYFPGALYLKKNGDLYESGVNSTYEFLTSSNPTFTKVATNVKQFAAEARSGSSPYIVYYAGENGKIYGRGTCCYGLQGHETHNTSSYSLPSYQPTFSSGSTYAYNASLYAQYSVSSDSDYNTSYTAEKAFDSNAAGTAWLSKNTDFPHYLYFSISNYAGDSGYNSHHGFRRHYAYFTVSSIQITNRSSSVNYNIKTGSITGGGNFGSSISQSFSNSNNTASSTWTISVNSSAKVSWIRINATAEFGNYKYAQVGDVKIYGTQYLLVLGLISSYEDKTSYLPS
jgi:hypothetical protein